MKKLSTIRRIIFHHSLSDFGNVKVVREWHLERGFSEIGYHFVITKSGKIQKGRSMIYRGAHAKGKNHDSIGICFIGDFYKYDVKPRQLASAIKLVYLLQSMSSSIYIDYHVNSLKKICPGPIFNRTNFKNRILKICPLLETR
jgi:N-acetylmuramoyl-L-alanine amidase